MSQLRYHISKHIHCMGVGEWGEEGGGKELTERGIQKHPVYQMSLYPSQTTFQPISIPSNSMQNYFQVQFLLISKLQS